MFRRSLTALAAGLVLTGALAVTTADAVSASPTRSGTVPATDPAQPDATHTCEYKYLCVHLENLQNGSYHWMDLYLCVKTPLPDGYLATWYVNNQTSGTKATFFWTSGSSTRSWMTPPAFSKGPVPDADDGERATDVVPC